MRNFNFFNFKPKWISNKSSRFSDSKSGFEFEIGQKLLEKSTFKNFKF